MMRFNGLLALFLGKDFTFRAATIPLGLMLGLTASGCSFSDDDDDDTSSCEDPTPEECKGDCYAACPSGETHSVSSGLP